MANLPRMAASLCFLCLAGSGAATQAQLSPDCSLSVLVSDPSGAGIPGAVVHTPDPRHAEVTDKDGEAQAWLCEASVLSAQAPGFKTTTIALSKPLPRKVAVTLKVADTGSGFPVKITNPIEPEQAQMSGNTSGAQTAPSAPPSGNTLALIGPTLQSVLAGDKLAAMPHLTITVENGHTHLAETYSGVPLLAVLEQVGAPSGKDVHGKALSEYIVATGADGYKAVLSLAEAEPDFHPGQILVADQLAGKPLDAKEGPFKLVVSEDKRPARSVHNLVRLELKSE